MARERYKQQQPKREHDMTDKVLVNGRLIDAEPRNPMQRFNDKMEKGENPGPSLAIKAMCWQCMGGDDSANNPDAEIVSAIRNCTFKPGDFLGCPLWEFRPYRGKK